MTKKDKEYLHADLIETISCIENQMRILNASTCPNKDKHINIMASWLITLRDKLRKLIEQAA